MTPEERADRLMTDFMDSDLHSSAVECIAQHIRAAENDALERAVQIVIDPDVYEWDEAERIRALKHP